MSDIPVIHCLSGALKGSAFPVTEHGLRLGREDGNEVVITDPGVSRQHARFIIHNSSLWVQDAGSRNGVFVNEERVQTQRQLSIGDKVKIGAHLFEVRLEAAPAVVPASVPGPAPKRGWKLWPFVVTFGILALLGLLVVVAGRRRAPEVPEPGKKSDAVVSLLLSASEGFEPGDGTTPPVAEGQAPGSSSLATTLLPSLLDGGDGANEAESKWPDPPKGVTAAELIEKGHNEYRAVRLRDALVAYHQAKKLQPECEICDRRIDRLNSEIAEAIENNFNDGLVYFNNLQYQQAVNSWETVLMLQPDPESARYKETMTYLEKARASVQSQY